MIYTKLEKSNSKKEIGILEIERHPPVLATFCKIFKTKETNVTIFTTKKIFDRIKIQLNNLDEFKFIIKLDKQKPSAFLKKAEKYCNKNIDLLFVNTIHETIFDLARYLNFNPKCRKVLTIHHVNAWLKPRLIFKPNKIIGTANTNLSLPLIKVILPRYDGINVIYSPLKDYIQKNLDYKKKIFTFPSSIFEVEQITKKDSDAVTIVVPGLIQKHRKKFEIILPVLKNLFKTYGNKIKVYILGRAVDSYGRNIQKEFEEFKKRGYNIVTYHHFVEEKTFHRVIKESDIILAPIRIESKADNEIKEYYGKTVGSGIIYNAIKFTKPIIVPSEFKMLKELETSTLKYDNFNELEKILTDYIEKPNVRKKLSFEAIKNAKNFSLEKLQDCFKDEALEWLKQI